eukprot:scaffold33002_cov32-Tisochrysis_lutea.AAC.4
MPSDTEMANCLESVQCNGRTGIRGFRIFSVVTGRKEAVKLVKDLTSEVSTIGDGLAILIESFHPHARGLEIKVATKQTSAKYGPVGVREFHGATGGCATSPPCNRGQRWLVAVTARAHETPVPQVAAPTSREDLCAVGPREASIWEACHKHGVVLTSNDHIVGSWEEAPRVAPKVRVWPHKRVTAPAKCSPVPAYQRCHSREVEATSVYLQRLETGLKFAEVYGRLNAPGGIGARHLARGK